MRVSSERGIGLSGLLAKLDQHFLGVVQVIPRVPPYSPVLAATFACVPKQVTGVKPRHDELTP